MGSEIMRRVRWQIVTVDVPMSVEAGRQLK